MKLTREQMIAHLTLLGAQPVRSAYAGWKGLWVDERKVFYVNDNAGNTGVNLSWYAPLFTPSLRCTFRCFSTEELARIHDVLERHNAETYS